MDARSHHRCWAEGLRSVASRFVSEVPVDVGVLSCDFNQAETPPAWAAWKCAPALG